MRADSGRSESERAQSPPEGAPAAPATESANRARHVRALGSAAASELEAARSLERTSALCESSRILSSLCRIVMLLALAKHFLHCPDPPTPPGKRGVLTLHPTSMTIFASQDSLAYDLPTCSCEGKGLAGCHQSTISGNSSELLYNTVNPQRMSGLRSTQYEFGCRPEQPPSWAIVGLKDVSGKLGT